MDGTLKFWDFNNGDVNHVINTHSKVYDIDLSKSEASLVAGLEDKSIRVWSPKSKELMYKMEETHTEPVCCVRFTNDENYIASTSTDDTIKIWDVRT
jgi:WD40 repeat protein